MPKVNQKQKLLFIIAGSISALVVFFFLFLNSPLFEVTHAQKELRLEAGTKPSTDPHTYLEGNNWSVALSYVDTSAVKHNTVGRYPIYINHGFKKYTTYVNIMDTTAPVVKSSVKNKTIVPGAVISAKNFGLEIEDCSEIERILFTKISSTKFYTGLPEEETVEIREAYLNGITMEAEDFQFSFGGIYTLTISVQDAFYNTSEVELTVTVEEPPVIEVPSNFYVANTPQINFADYIRAWDFIEGDLDISDIEIDTSKLNMSASGTYPVVFTVTDRYGLTATKTSNVHVSSQKNLQSLLNKHTINLATDVVIGVNGAYDSGYYEDDNLILRQQNLLPCVVHIKNDFLESFGSGFIIEINNDFVTIATNQHVIQNDLIVEVTFFDGESRFGSVVASDEESDIAFIRIPINGADADSSVSSTYIQKLRSVHIDKGYWEGLANNYKLAIAYTCIDENGKVWNNNIGYIVGKIAIRDWNEFKGIKQTLLSFNTIAGTSGSALFDGHGQLMGMIRGYTNYGSHRENIAVPLCEILRYFELIFKYKIT